MNRFPTGSESRDSHLAFIMGNWSVLAAWSWRGYQEGGRGCMVIDSKQASTEPTVTSRLGETPAVYLVADQVPEIEEVRRMIREYDPETEVVVVILRLDGGQSEYRLRGPVLPVDAYRALEGEM